MVNLQAILKSQYHAALATLRQPIERCPDELWTADGHANPVWRIAYHTLFFTHFYLQKNHESFTPWEHDRADAHRLGEATPPAYTRAQVLDYWQFCNAMVDPAVDALDLAAADCGFPWYPMGKLEHQLVNIRHIQHHAAQLADRVRMACGADFDWVGKG